MWVEVGPSCRVGRLLAQPLAPWPVQPADTHASCPRHAAETIQVWLAGRQLAAPNLRWVSQRGRCVCLLPSCRSSCRAVHDSSKFGAPWFGRRFACPSSHTIVCVTTEKSTDYRKFLLVGVPNSNYLTKCLDVSIHDAQHCTVAHLIEVFVVWSGLSKKSRSPIRVPQVLGDPAQNASTF